MVAFRLFWTPTLPLVEATTLEVLEQRNWGYEKIRLWGSIGFILLSTGFRFILDQTATRWVIHGKADFFIPKSPFCHPASGSNGEAYGTKNQLDRVFKAPRGHHIPKLLFPDVGQSWDLLWVFLHFPGEYGVFQGNHRFSVDRGVLGEILIMGPVGKACIPVPPVKWKWDLAWYLMGFSLKP